MVVASFEVKAGYSLSHYLKKMYQGFVCFIFGQNSSDYSFSVLKKKSSCRLYRISGENKIDFQLPLIALTECDNHFHCRVKPRIVRISPKFTHFGRVQNEFSASKFEYSKESIRKPTEIDRNSSNSVGTEFFSEIESQNLGLYQGLFSLLGVARLGHENPPIHSKKIHSSFM